MPDRERLLLVVQRYGPEIVGGSEQYAGLVARRLSQRRAVEVATTTALDYRTWAAHFPAGTADIDGVTVHRFPVAARRSGDFDRYGMRILTQPHRYEEERQWLRRQGPHAPELLDFLHHEGRTFDAVIFVTYLYAPTAEGLPLLPERSVLIPTAHEEGPLRLTPYRMLFQLPRAIGFLTPEERDLVHGTFRNEHIFNDVLGVGLDPPPAHRAEAFRSRHQLDGPLVLYLGRIVRDKGCDTLFDHWRHLAESAPTGATLVLAGEAGMPLPDRRDVVYVGRLSEEEKFSALAAADVLVQPSLFESLGIVLLEAWQVGTPVLVDARNVVTSGQVGRSGGGLTYESADEFARGLELLLRDGRGRGDLGRTWVERECSWEAWDVRMEDLVLAAAGAHA